MELVPAAKVRVHSASRVDDRAVWMVHGSCAVHPGAVHGGTVQADEKNAGKHPGEGLIHGFFDPRSSTYQKISYVEGPSSKWGLQTKAQHWSLRTYTIRLSAQIRRECRPLVSRRFDIHSTQTLHGPWAWYTLACAPEPKTDKIRSSLGFTVKNLRLKTTRRASPRILPWRLRPN